MPKPLRLPDDDRPRKKKKVADDSLPVGPIIGMVVGAVVLLGLIGVVWWATRGETAPPPRPAPAPSPASTPSTEVRTAPTKPKPPPTADEYYEFLVGGVWTRTADDPLLGGKKTVSLTFLADKTLVVKQTVPDLLGGITGEAPGKDKELATTMTISSIEVKADRLLLLRTDDASLLGAGFKRFRLRLNADGTINLTETGDESKFQATPYTREKRGG